MAAPGFSERSTRDNNLYNSIASTSAASPHAAGVAALIWDQNPTWTNVSVRSKLRNTAVDVPPTGQDNNTGYGRIDALKAVQAAPPVSVAIAGPSIVDAGIQNSWWADNLSGGVAPYTYQWWGVLSGSQSSISGSLSSSGTLFLKVTSTDGQTKTTSKFITVNQGGGCPPMGC